VAYVNYSVTATDACTNVTIVCDPPGNLFPLGATTVTCIATDCCTNRSVCSFTVTVKSDATPLFESEPNDGLLVAHDLGDVKFAVLVGRIAPAGDVDFYKFTAPANGRAWITVDSGATMWAGATSRDSVVSLLNAGGAVLETDDNDGSGNGADSILESGDASAIAGALLTAGGTYYVRVNAAAAGQVIAPYRLYLTVTPPNPATESEPNNTFAQANAMVIPAAPTGVRLAALTSNDEDWYAFTLMGSSIVHISVDGDPERDGTGTDIVVELYRKDGVSLLFAANSSASGPAVAEGFAYRLSLKGTYFVRVHGASPSVAGTYRIMIGTCAGLPQLPLTAVAQPVGRGLVLSWPAGSEPAQVLSTRDLRTWEVMPLTPTLDGDRLIAVLPTDPPHQFFLLSPDGGWSNDTYWCCDGNGQNCVGVLRWGPCGGLRIRCYETEDSSVCEPAGIFGL
jgi:hypothetical protein